MVTSEDSTTQPKQCTKCKQKFPPTTEYFHAEKRTKSGLMAACKTCRNAARFEYDQSHREEHRARQRLYDAANVKALSEAKRVRRAKNPEKTREIDHQRYLKFGDARRESARRWARENPGKHATITRNRRARERAAEGTHTLQDVAEQLKRQRGRCYYCKCKVGKKYHVDHVVPISRGGRNDPSNLVIACNACNLSKQDKLPHEWARGGRLL